MYRFCTRLAYKSAYIPRVSTVVPLSNRTILDNDTNGRELYASLGTIFNHRRFFHAYSASIPLHCIFERSLR